MTDQSTGFAERAAAWDKSVEADGKITPNPETLAFTIDALQRQIDWANTIIQQIETKAALIIPAIGVILGIVGPSLPTSALSKSGVTPWVLAGSGVCLVLCALLAVASLWPRSRSNGPRPLLVVRGAGETLGEARWNYLWSLGFVAETANAVGLAKGRQLAWSLALGAVSVVLLAVFVALGGLKP